MPVLVGPSSGSEGRLAPAKELSGKRLLLLLSWLGSRLPLLVARLSGRHQSLDGLFSVSLFSAADHLASIIKLPDRAATVAWTTNVFVAPASQPASQPSRATKGAHLNDS